MNDLIFNENEYGEEIFFITSGKVVIIHKQTVSYITDLRKDDYFGEISFFSDLPR